VPLHQTLAFNLLDPMHSLSCAAEALPLPTSATSVQEVGAELDDLARGAMHEVVGRMRSILQEGAVAKKTQFQLENLMAIRKAGFEKQGYVAVKPELDLVEEDDQIEHEVLCPPALCIFDSALHL
jgi:hypothetical protein